MSQNYGSLDKIDPKESLLNLTQRIRNNLQNIRQITQSLNDIYLILGGPHDSSARQDDIHKQQVRANSLLSLTKSMFESMAQVGTIDQDSRVHINRLNEEYEGAVKKYGEIQAKIMAKMQQIVREKRTVIGTDSLVDTQESLQTQTQMMDNEDDLRLAEEAEQRVQQLEKDLINVQRMYTDINQLVMEDRERIEHVHDNVEAANVNVMSGNIELENAATYKKKALKKKIIIIIVVLVLLVIIGLIIYFSLRK